MRKLALLLLPLLPFGGELGAQCPELAAEVTAQLKEHVEFLASDKLAGRKPGTEGAAMAAEYITAQYEAMGLQPIEANYYQQFAVPVEVEFNSKNKMLVEGEALQLPQDFYPLQWAAQAEASGQNLYVGYGISAPELDHDDYAKLSANKRRDKIFIMDISAPDGIHPHSAYLKYHDLGERIELARDKGASAVVLINLEGMASDLPKGFKQLRDKGLPVVFVTNNELARQLRDKKLSLTIATALEEKSVEAFNLVAELDNGASQTVLIGAHYDHLGLGGSSSLYHGEEAIHNGADDNASGVASMLELARFLKENKADYGFYNYRFVAFSAEEMGLLGSSFYVDSESGQAPLHFMLNLDMVGRLEEDQLAINGVGTTRAWTTIIDKLQCEGLRIKTSRSGVGPSDHTNFYHEQVPVLHFFSGTHSDYHKPSDDADKINYDGMRRIMAYMLALIRETEGEKMEWRETASESTKAPRFSVTLGVMPDYMFEGEGMRIDGVTSDRPAARAGLQAGDVITRLGEVKVVDMMSYMKALGQFKKGDQAQVEYRRGEQTLQAEIQF